MRVLRNDKAEGSVKVIADHIEDLWHVERVIEAGDLVSAKSWRRFKTSEGESGEKKEVLIQVRAEQIEFSETANRVRVTGKIVAGGPVEFIQIGSYHTIDVEPGFPVEIKKEGGWQAYQLDRLYDAQKASKRRVKLGIVAMDEKEANFASMKEYGVSFDFKVENRASKREADYSKKQLEYYGEITKSLKESKAGKLIVAGPGFAKDNLRKFIADREPELLKKLAFETASTSEPSGVYELLKRGAVERVLGEERVAKEFAFMEELVREISTDSGLAVYGEKEVRDALKLSAIAKLFVTDELLRKDKSLKNLMDGAEKLRCEVHIFSSENPAGKQLAGLSGIAAMLRFKMR